MSVAERVKKIRETLGKTQKDMAISIQISYRTWQNYEDGVNSPNWDVCETLVKLGFNANWLLTGEGDMKLGAEVYPLAEGLKNGNTTGELPASFDHQVRRADRSPIKQAAVSYIDDMTDNEASEIVRIIIARQNDALLSVTGKDREELIKVMREQINKAKEYESLSSETDSKLTGT